MRGSPDIPEIHPLPTPHFLHMIQTLQSVDLGKGETFLHCFLPSPTPTRTPRSHPRGSLAGKPCVQDDITDQPLLSTSIVFYIHSLEAHCRISQRLEQVGIQ